MSLWRVCGRVAEMWRNKGASSFCSSQSEKMFSVREMEKTNRTKEEKVGRRVNDGQGSEQADYRVHYVTRIRRVA